ncbi:hypothetical protein HQ531_10820 [bacterium]|nr:hypothetical protein [bacterium]
MKKISINKRTGLTLLILVTSLGLVSCNSHRDRHHNRSTDHIMQKSVKQLDLNAEQQTKLQDVLDDMESFKSKMKLQHADFSTPLKENLSKSEINLSQLNEHFDDFELELRQFRQSILTKYADFHATLTDEQREKLLGFLEKMEKRHKS